MTLTQDAGRCALTAETRWIGGDLLIVLTGGDAHIGSVSLASEGELSSLQRPRHRDAALGDRFARGLHRALGRPVTVVCGVHVDSISPEEIKIILGAGDRLLERLTIGLQSDGPGNISR